MTKSRPDITVGRFKFSRSVFIVRTYDSNRATEKMLKYFFILILLHGVLAFPSNKVSDENCEDVLVACKNIQSAQSCKSVVPCIKVWENVRVPEDNNEICDLCKEMVKEAKDQLMSNETQEELKEVFEGSCRLIPIRAITKECIAVVDQLIPTLIESLASRMDPTQVCTVAGLCNNGKLVSLMKEQISEITPLLIAEISKKPEKCTQCQAAMTFIKKMLKFIGLDAFTQLTFQACQNEFDGNMAKCEIIVRDVIPIVYHYLKSMDPSVFCGAMKSCPFKQPLPKPVGDNLTCEFCEALVQYAKTIFTSASTKEEFRTAFTNMCKDLRKFSSECSSLVNEYFDQFYDFIVRAMDGKATCTALGLCGDSSNSIKMVKTIPAIPMSKVEIFPAVAIAKQANRVGLRIIDSEPKYEHRPGIEVRLPASSLKMNRVPTEHTDADIETNDIDGVESSQPQQLPPERFLHPSVISQNDVMCTVCKTVIQYVDDALKDKKSEDEIRALLDKVCSYLPSELSDQCQDFVNEYTDMIVQLLIQEVDPDHICALLKLCPDGVFVKSIPIQPKGVFCEICVKVMQYVEHELGDNATEEAIRRALDTACSILPGPYASKCQDFMDKYSEMIFELLSKEVAPRLICSAIGICPFGSEAKPKSEIECQLCQYTLHYIQGRLMDNSTQEEIKQLLENACHELPQTLAAECKNYIEQYGDSVLALIAQEIDPSVICVKLNICPAIGLQSIDPEPILNVKELEIDTCGTCELVVDYMDKLLENDDVEREIVKLVEKVCAVVPESTRDQCKTIIEAYGPYILQMIGQLADSKEVCQTIDLCSRVPGHVHLLGGEKCTFGPTYWCQTSAHASACKAEDYCKEKVW